MAWPVPDIPQYKTVPAPKLWLWVIALIFMLATGIFCSLWAGNVSTYVQVFFYGVLPAFLVWLCLFGMVLNRYEQSSAANWHWNNESEHTRVEWQSWSRRQLAVVGNVLLSPEEKGMDRLLGDLEDVPVYPDKSRPLFNSSDSYSAIMNDIAGKLEQQFPGYRYLLHSVYVLQASGRYEKLSSTAIFEKWDLVPVSIHSFEPIERLYDAADFDGLMLVICLQDWTHRSAGLSSEFISAQLIASPSLARQQGFPVIAGLTRMMPLEPGELLNELDMFFRYNQPDKQTLEYVWLTGAAEKTAADIMQYAAQHQWRLPEKRPLHSIDLSFGPPGEMILPLSLSMLAEAASKTDKDQLLIMQTPQQTGTLCLITRELYA